MTFRSLALSNIRGNWRSYSAFFLSSVFSVFIFYIYASVLMHPDIANGKIMAASMVREGMKFCLYLIVIFSFLFILYSNSAFLKTRKKEFGLYSLFGMTRSQLRKMVILENTAISLFAITVGIAVGIVLSKLFFMALAVLLGLDETIPFIVPVKAVALTAGGFFALFFVLSIWSSLRIGKSQIIDLLKAGQKPKGKLIYSKWLVAVSLLSLAGCYTMATIMDGNSFILLAMPILITAVVGTYFLFTQFSVLLLKLLQKRKKTYYNRTNMLIISQLGYKIRDNARVLFTVSILSAVILTAMGSVYILQVQLKDDAFKNFPHALAFVEEGEASQNIVQLDQLEKQLDDAGLKIKFKDQFIGVKITDYEASIQTSDGNRGVGFHGTDERHGMIISESAYNDSAGRLGLKKLKIESGKLALVKNAYQEDLYEGKLTAKFMGDPISFEISEWVDGQAMNNWMDSSSITFVADDATYNSMLEKSPVEERAVYYGYELKNWEKSAPFLKQFSEKVPSEHRNNISINRILQYNSAQESAGLTLFIGLFISLLFFVSAGSMIYFKLFTEMQEDKSQFNSLTRIGMTRAEIRKIVVSQIAIVFFIPCIVGVVHALFAMKSLENIINSSTWLYSFVVFGIFLVMQFIYFLLASSSYMKGLTGKQA